MREECGIYGIYSFSDEAVAKSVFYGLFALQHRGQESAGIAVSDGEEVRNYKAMGLVSQVFDERTLQNLPGKIAIGHVRYSTTGSSVIENAQPIKMDMKYGSVVIAHNGNLINSGELRQELKDKGISFEGTTDSEVMAAMIATSAEEDLEDAIVDTLKHCKGGFSVVILTRDKLIAVRDPNGIRPLVVGKLPDGYVFASETSALDIVGAVFMRDVGNGEMVVIDHEGLHSRTWSRGEREALCIFEFIYFARPDSNLDGRNVYEARVQMGKYLAKEHPADVDLIIGVPDSGIAAAIGFAAESKIPFSDGLIKNRYVGRTFIQPTQKMRDMGVKLKLNPLRETLRGKKVVVIDDSIVRGTTSRQIIGLLREAGVREVHMRVSSPPIAHSCFYGIDTPTRAELIAANLSIEGIRKYLDVESLGYLSLDSLVKSIGLGRRGHCLACFNSEYPIKVPEKLKSLKLIFK